MRRGVTPLSSPSGLRELQLYHRALGDTTRLRIVGLLAGEGELTVSALTRALRVSQPLMSWHLRRLRRAGIVRTVRVGREVRCSLDRERFDELQARTVRVVANGAEVAR
jgi:ArsR family transcriptional regulator